MTANKRGIATDLKVLDEHVIQPEEYEDAPELTDEQLARAEIREGDRLIRINKDAVKRQKPTDRA